MNIEYWVINALTFAIAPLVYVVYHQYKDNKELRGIVELYKRALELKSNKNEGNKN